MYRFADGQPMQQTFFITPKCVIIYDRPKKDARYGLSVIPKIKILEAARFASGSANILLVEIVVFL